MDIDDDTGGNGGWWRAWPRRAGVLAVTVGVAVLAAACGGSPTGSTGSSQAGGSTTYQKDLAYAQCMRSHGVPNFPDPNSSGQFVIQGNDSQGEESQMQTAKKDCQNLLPNGGQVPASVQQQRLSELLKYAKCMRSHGLPNFPDPNSRGGLSLAGTGIKPSDPRLQSAQQACQSLMPHVGGA